MKAYTQFLKELPSKKIVFAFGRFQPPTNGHELLVKAVEKLAKEQNAAHIIYASHSQDKTKNPLPVDRKVYYLKRMFPGANFKAAGGTTRTFIEVAKELNKKYKDIIMVAGSDRVPEYKKILEKYNGTEFHFDTVSVVSAGERDPDADNASGMSGTKMREAAKKGDFNLFKKGLPHTLTTVDGKRLMNEIREGMGMEPIKEQVKLATDWLRESYYRGEIFNIGDVVESNNVVYKIIKRGSNHLLLQTESGEIQNKFIHDVVTSDKQFNGKIDEMKFSSSDKLKVARIIADALGVVDVEKTSSPEQLVNNALRKIRNKPMRTEYLNVVKKMLQTAKEAGIDYDAKFVPQKVDEGYDEVQTSDTKLDKHGRKIHARKLRFKNSEKEKDDLDEQAPVAPSIGVHRIQVTVSEPDHPMVSKRKETVQKFVRVTSKEKETAVEQGKNHFKKKGFKVHSAEHVGMVHEETQLDEISQKLAGNYYGAATKKHIEKVGVKKDMYNRIEKDMGKNRKAGVDRALDRITGARKTNEDLEEGKRGLWDNIHAKRERIKAGSGEKMRKPGSKGAPSAADFKAAANEEFVIEGAYEKAEENKRSADSAKKQGDMFAHHLHMADHHENLSQWHSSKGRHGEADRHAEKAEQHHEKAMSLKEQATPYYNKPSFLSKMSRIAKQERLAREKKEAEAAAAKKKPVKEENELEESESLDELSNATLQNYKDKAMKSADDLAAKGDYKKSNDRLLNHMKASGKQIDRTTSNIKKALNKEEAECGCEEDEMKPKIGDTGKLTYSTIKNFLAIPDKKNNPNEISPEPETTGIPASPSPLRVKHQRMHEEAEDFSDLQEPADAEFEEELANMCEPEHIIDAYDDDEFVIIDSVTGEELDTEGFEDDDTEAKLKEGVIVILEISRMERMRRKQRFARTKSKREVRAQIALRKSSNTATINKRSRRLAISMIKKRMLRKDPSKATMAEKERVERFVQTRKGLIDRLARRVSPRIRQIEKARLQHKRAK